MEKLKSVILLKELKILLSKRRTNIMLKKETKYFWTAEFQHRQENIVWDLWFLN
jgi:hypothetical protein